MECLVVFFVVLAICLVACGSLIRHQSETRRRRQSYQRIAKRFSGRYQPGGLLSRAAVLMRYGETNAVLCEQKSRGPYHGPCTQMQLRFPDAQLNLELLPGDRRDEAAPIQRLAHAVCGDERFQRAFFVRADGRTDADRLFSDGVCWQVQRLAEMVDGGRLWMRLYRSKLLIQKPLLLRDFELLEKFVAISFELFDQMLLTRAEGINFIASDVQSALGESKCSICGEAILDDMVYCQRCKTPHHGECWEYIGSCSVFGCQERQYLRPQAGTPKT